MPRPNLSGGSSPPTKSSPLLPDLLDLPFCKKSMTQDTSRLGVGEQERLAQTTVAALSSRGLCSVCQKSWPSDALR